MMRTNEPIWFLDGEFCPASLVKIPVTDLAVQRGYGVFETLRTYRGKVFKLNAHLDRLFQSAKLIGLSLPWSQKYLQEKILETLTKNNYPESVIKIIVTGGQSRDFVLPEGKPRLAILVTELHPYPQDVYYQGIKVVTFPYQRFLPRSKNLDYTIGVLARIRAKQKGAVEALYVDRGFILEATTSNFFLVKNKTIITAKEGVLYGITRNEVIKIAQDLGLKVKERKIKLAELSQAQEAFLTSTLREILPVVWVDKIKIGNGQPGKITLTLLAAFRQKNS